MNREKFKEALELTGEVLTGIAVFSFPFVAFWLKYIFWD